jgi:hypothetical protein
VAAAVAHQEVILAVAAAVEDNELQPYHFYPQLITP